VLHAVDDMLVEVGYAAMTMKGIADEPRWSTNGSTVGGRPSPNPVEACVDDARSELNNAAARGCPRNSSTTWWRQPSFHRITSLVSAIVPCSVKAQARYRGCASFSVLYCETSSPSQTQIVLPTGSGRLRLPMPEGPSRRHATVRTDPRPGADHRIRLTRSLLQRPTPNSRPVTPGRASSVTW